MNSRQGFTIVELMTVVVVLSIVLAISIVAYGGWRSRVAQASLESDLTAAATAMDNERQFNNLYPVALPQSFRGDTSRITVHVTGGGQAFCLEGRAAGLTDTLVIRSGNSQVVKGHC